MSEEIKPLHMLAVDDEPAALGLIQQIFRREIRRGEVRIDCAENGQQAMNFLQSEEGTDVVLILSDINMPGMSGLELVGKIKEQWPEPPPFVFVISAYNEREEEAHQAGADRFFSKPLDIDAIKECVLELKGVSR